MSSEKIEEKIVKEILEHKNGVKYRELREKYGEKFIYIICGLITTGEVKIYFSNEAAKYPEEVKTLTKVFSQYLRTEGRKDIWVKYYEEMKRIREPVLVSPTNLRKCII